MLISDKTVAQLLVECLEKEGVEYVFGLPGEENIRIVDAMSDSSIRFILVRSEQGAAFMAEVYGRLTGKAGVCAATLGPGAINLLLGVADGHLNSAPLVAISAQAGVHRLHKESHQSLDLVSIFKPTTPSSQPRWQIWHSALRCSLAGMKCRHGDSRWGRYPAENASCRYSILNEVTEAATQPTIEQNARWQRSSTAAH